MAEYVFWYKDRGEYKLWISTIVFCRTHVIMPAIKDFSYIS